MEWVAALPWNQWQASRGIGGSFGVEYACLRPQGTTTTLRQCRRMAWAMLVMTGRGTMLGLSRWAGRGGSYRTVQRFFSQALPWTMRFGVCFRQHMSSPGEVYLLVGDEVVVTQAGKTTHGLDRGFASVYGKPVPGRAFFTLSLVSVQARRSFPMRVAQVGRSDTEKAASKAQAEAQQPRMLRPQRRPGRPLGSTNRTKMHVTRPPELVRIKAMRAALRPLIMQGGPLTSLVLDGHFGHHNALQMVRQCDVPLLSTLRCDAACSLPYTGPYAGRGPPRKDGRKIDCDPLPVPYRKETTVEGHIQPRLYPMQRLPKVCAHPLNVVILAKTNLRPQARAQGSLLSSDLDLASALRVDEYRLRFQIEVNCRDAKQDRGLADFMNVPPTGVTNAAHLSLCRVNVAYRRRADLHSRDADASVLDLKADCRGYPYVAETMKMLPENPAPILVAKILHQVAGLGRIHVSPPSFSFS